MKRPVMKGDFRSNVSRCRSRKIELTELEKKTAVKSIKITKGMLTGVDMFPSKNRETEEPYVLEVNSTAGLTSNRKGCSHNN